LDTISEINWDEIWQKQMNPIASKGEDAAYWDKRACCKVGTHDNYTQELLKRIKKCSNESALDVGCGSGGVTIPLSRLMQQVTALDISPLALTAMQKEALKAGVTNIIPVVGDFSNLYLSNQIKSHDIVIASRSLPMGNLKQSLTIMNTLAKKSCYLTWTAGDNELLKNVCQILGKQYSPFPEYLIILVMLYTMGIHANLELFSSEGSCNYASLEEVVSEAIQRYTIPKEEINEELTEYVKNQLIIDNGQYHWVIKSEWALIWWDVNPKKITRLLE